MNTTSKFLGLLAASLIAGLSHAGIQLTNLVSFAGTNGRMPLTLIQAIDGNFYGTTFVGGQFDRGTLFKLSTNGVCTTLTSFNGQMGESVGILLQGRDGNLYGTTAEGGLGMRGTIWKATPAGVVTNLFSFNGTKGAHLSF